MFYDLIAQYGGETITDDFDVRFHSNSRHWDADKEEWVIRSYYLNFATLINGCRSTETFHFTFRKDGDTYVCNEIAIRKPVYNPSAVKPPRTLAVAEEKVALERERARVLEMPYNGEKVEDRYQIKEQEIEYFYNIQEDRNYYVITTRFRDEVGWGDEERAEFEIER